MTSTTAVNELSFHLQAKATRGESYIVGVGKSGKLGQQKSHKVQEKEI